MLLPAKRVPGGLSACLGPTRERRGLSPTTPRSVQLRRLCSQTGLCCVELVIRQSLVNQGSRVCSQCMWDLGTPQSHKIALPPPPPPPRDTDSFLEQMRKGGPSSKWIQPHTLGPLTQPAEGARFQQLPLAVSPPDPNVHVPDRGVPHHCPGLHPQFPFLSPYLGIVNHRVTVHPREWPATLRGLASKHLLERC